MRIEASAYADNLLTVFKLLFGDFLLISLQWCTGGLPTTSPLGVVTGATGRTADHIQLHLLGVARHETSLELLIGEGSKRQPAVKLLFKNELYPQFMQDPFLASYLFKYKREWGSCDCSWLHSVWRICGAGCIVWTVERWIHGALTGTRGTCVALWESYYEGNRAAGYHLYFEMCVSVR